MYVLHVHLITIVIMDTSVALVLIFVNFQDKIVHVKQVLNANLVKNVVMVNANPKNKCVLIVMEMILIVQQVKNAVSIILLQPLFIIVILIVLFSVKFIVTVTVMNLFVVMVNAQFVLVLLNHVMKILSYLVAQYILEMK